MGTSNHDYAIIPSIAHAFCEGMAQATREISMKYLVHIQPEFIKRGIKPALQQAVDYKHSLLKTVLSTDGRISEIEHPVSRFSLEYLCMLSALNLYRLPMQTEQIKAELITARFLDELDATEWEWLGLYNAKISETNAGSAAVPGKWRHNIVQEYLHALQTKSSLDSDVLVATRLFFQRQGLCKEAGVEVTPAMIEACTIPLTRPAEWLQHYMKYNRV